MAERSGDVVFRVDQSDNDSDLWDDSALIKAYDKAISCVKGMTNDGSEKEGKNKPKTRRGGKKNKKKKNFTPAQTRWKVGDRCKSVFTEDDMVYSAMVTSINNKKSSCIVRYAGYGNEEEKRLSDLFTESEAEASVNSKAELENGYDSMEWTDHSQSPMHPSGSGAGPRKRSHHHPYPPHPPPHPAGMPQPLGYPNPYGGTWYPPHPGPPPPMPPPPPMMSPLPFAPWGSPAATPMMPGWGGTSPHPASQTPPHQQIPSMPPTPPPHPPLPDDVEDMDKEALHSMLMSWYMSGYHTGYYEGLKKSKESSDSTTSKTKDNDTTPRRAGQGKQSRTKDEVKEATPSQPDEKSQDISQES